jgi:outer membrane protein W
VKTLGFGRSVIITATLLAVTSGRAGAQPAPRLVQGDASATIGWLSTNTRPRGEPAPYDHGNWANSLFGAASAGWYWTDNVKTEMDFGAGTAGREYSTRQVTIDGHIGYASTATRLSSRTLGISQQYQFLHNAWFHPHVAAGVNLTWQRRTDNVAPLYLFDDVARTSRIVTPAHVDGPRTFFAARPFVAAGFKAYITPRTFFRNDLRVAFRGGPNETTLRFGFGFDF